MQVFVYPDRVMINTKSFFGNTNGICINVRALLWKSNSFRQVKKYFWFISRSWRDSLTFLAFQDSTTSFNSFWITGTKQKISDSLCVSRSAQYIPSWNICWKHVFYHDKQNLFKRAQKASIRWFLTDARYLKFSTLSVNKTWRSSK